MVILMVNNINDGIPLGLLFKISTNYKALNNFSKLNEQKLTEITNYIQNSSTGNEAQEKINIAIKSLENNDLEFLN